MSEFFDMPASVILGIGSRELCDDYVIVINQIIKKYFWWQLLTITLNFVN
jgi:hypothetical protein